MSEPTDLGTPFTPPTTAAPSPAVEKKPAKVDDGSAPTILEQLRAELSKEVRRDEVFLEVPERSNILLRIDPNVTPHQIKAWRKNSGENSKQGIDGTKFACFVLANTCTGILINNEIVMDAEGFEVTFSSQQILDFLGASRVNEAVVAMFGIEPHVESAALAVLQAAGFNDDVEQVDPTKVP